MRSLELENSMEQLSVVDLFDSIDNVDNNNDENDKIIEKIKDKMVILLSSHLKKRKEKERKEAMFQRYRAYLNYFQELIEKQMAIIDELIDEEDTYDISDTFLKLKKELIDYSMQIYKLDLLDMSEVLNKKEKNIYEYIHLYDFLEKYHSKSEKCNFPSVIQMEQVHKKEDKTEEKLVSSNWKTYYYLVICLEKQQEYNHTFTSYFMTKNEAQMDKQLFIKLSNFYAADFQGQLSKNIYCQRKKMKLTQMQLSERSGIDRTMIAKIEKVKQPTTLETAIKLLSSLNMGIAIYPFAEIEKKF